MAAANATTRSRSFFHPEHLLARCNYSEASTYPCAACERVVTGTGYRCGECNFNIHILPLDVKFDGHPDHVLKLARLGASRWCHVCKETSGAGRYMYFCSLCNFDVHPRCTSLVLRLQQPAPPQPARRNRGYRGVFKVIRLGLRVANLILNPHTFFTGN